MGLRTSDLKKNPFVEYDEEMTLNAKTPTYISIEFPLKRSDDVILLHYIREQSEVKRAITVLKTRGSQLDPSIKQFNINPGGLDIGGEFSAETAFRFQ